MEDFLDTIEGKKPVKVIEEVEESQNQTDVMGNQDQ